jgi:hypothetical protein
MSLTFRNVTLTAALASRYPYLTAIALPPTYPYLSYLAPSTAGRYAFSDCETVRLAGG